MFHVVRKSSKHIQLIRSAHYITVVVILKNSITGTSKPVWLFAFLEKRKIMPTWGLTNSLLLHIFLIFNLSLNED